MHSGSVDWQRASIAAAHDQGGRARAIGKNSFSSPAAAFPMAPAAPACLIVRIRIAEVSILKKKKLSDVEKFWVFGSAASARERPEALAATFRPASNAPAEGASAISGTGIFLRKNRELFAPEQGLIFERTERISFSTAPDRRTPQRRAADLKVPCRPSAHPPAPQPTGAKDEMAAGRRS